jgi:HD-GYP domain-containing protein (c-di-GMP phosphodiesterase class II)
MHEKFKQVINKKTLEKLFVFILIFIIAIYGLYNLNSKRIKNMENLLDEALHSYIFSNAEGISSGYFQRNGVYESFVEKNGVLLNQIEEDIVNQFEIVNSIEVVEETFDGFYDYKIYTKNQNCYINFGVFDKFQHKYIEDRVVRIKIDPRVMFNNMFNGNKVQYEINVVDNESIDGINVVGTENPLKLFHYASAFSMALLALLIIQIFSRLLINRHYETEGLRNMIMVLSKRDAYTGVHSDDVARYAKIIAEHIGFSRKKQRSLEKAGYLHDVGKIGISDSILNKQGKLTYDEFEEIKKHSIIGYEIISQFPNLKEVELVVKYHHERLDGSGYPDGLKCDEIPLEAQILAVADVYSALTTDRPYRIAMDHNKAFKIMEEMSLNQTYVQVLKKSFK